MSNKVSVLVGADPELFIKDKDGRFLSAHTMVPGTKVSPFEVTKGALQVDGLAAEFNITPAKDSATFVSNIKQVITSLRDHIGDKGILTAVPTATFEKGYFDSLPPEVKELGCNPDFNAWTGQVNPSPDPVECMRTAAGHIHIGWCEGVDPHSKFHFEDCCTFIKELDYFLTIYSLAWDPDPTRRKMYGRAGAFRPKTYGAEHRGMSNVWLKSPKLQVWIFDAVQKAFNNLVNGKKSMVDQFGDLAQKIIDGNQVDWNTTKDGQKIHLATGMPWPDVSNLKDIEDQKKVPPQGELLEEYRKLAEKLGISLSQVQKVMS